MKRKMVKMKTGIINSIKIQLKKSLKIFKKLLFKHLPQFIKNLRIKRNHQPIFMSLITSQLKSLQIVVWKVKDSKTNSETTTIFYNALLQL